MSQQRDKIVIFFADVSGSTQLYERFGDTEAYDCISESLQRIVDHASQYGGRLIETIGDEVMIAFERPKDAARAACAMQQAFDTTPVNKTHFIKIRIGFHFGPIEYDERGRPFGDTINVAARVVALCEPGRIVATQDSLDSCRERNEFVLRPYQRTRVRGKSEPLVLEEVVWEIKDTTSLSNVTQNTMVGAPELTLELKHLGKRIILTSDQPPFVIGRGVDCDLIVESALASRRHCLLEFRWGEVYVVDHSTNGTYLSTGSERSAITRLHRREMPIKGQGTISIGAPLKPVVRVCQISYKIR